MAKRTIYVLRDSVTGLYYTGKSNNFYSWKGDVAFVDVNSPYHTFKDAVIHTTENSIKDGLKSRVRAFKRDLTIEDETIVNAPWMILMRKIARERKDLPSFGIEIVAIEISDGKA